MYTSRAGCESDPQISWEKDGIAYYLSGSDLGMSAEEMLDMAEEILKAE